MASLRGGLAAEVASAPADPKQRRGARAPLRLQRHASRVAAALCSRHAAAVIARLGLGSTSADQPGGACGDDASSGHDASPCDAEPGRRADPAACAGGEHVGARGLGPDSCAVCRAEDAALAACVAAAVQRARPRRARAAAPPPPLGEEHNCPICFDTLHAPAVTPCGHTFCDHCIRHYLQLERWSSGRPCPLCRAPVAAAQLTADAALAALIKARAGREAHAARAERVRVERQALEAAAEQDRTLRWPPDSSLSTLPAELPGLNWADSDDSEDTSPEFAMAFGLMWSDAPVRQPRASGQRSSPFAATERRPVLELLGQGNLGLLDYLGASGGNSLWANHARRSPQEEAVAEAIARVSTLPAEGAAAEAAPRLRELETASRRQRRTPEWADAAAMRRRRR